MTGGLVVSADIEHAEEITEWLMDQGKDVCLVTSKMPNAHAKLQAFRDSTQAWIVSVGMISKGVDIPRLRVCCYLSRIRTEQHFRQVLGRGICRLGLHDPDCFLFVLNESLLRRYVQRITDDLPDEKAIVTLVSPTSASAASGYGNTAPGAPLDNVTRSDGETAEVDNEAGVWGIDHYNDRCGCSEGTVGAQDGVFTAIYRASGHVEALNMA
ncbi:DEAD/DEAH box helicase [Stutzerimonas xanthomarina]|uniref:DEAD/DEAH box helicase n=1 Tax=Stutzerimonas xanthomarina TaxID=271420 RepID=UPI003AA842E2